MKGTVKARANSLRRLFFITNRRLARNLMELAVRLCWIMLYLFVVGNFQQFTQASQLWLLWAVRLCAVAAFSSGLFLVAIDLFDGSKDRRYGWRFIGRILILLLMLTLILGVNNMKVWLEGVKV